MADITIQAHYIPNWTLVETAGAVVTISFELTVDGIDGDNISRLAKTGPDISAKVYKWDTVDSRFEDDLGVALPMVTPAPTIADGPYLLYIPQASGIGSTTDWLRPACCPAYNLRFILPSGNKVKWSDYFNTSIPATPTTTTWAQISLFNKSGGPPMRPPYTYTREEINALFENITITEAAVLAALGYTPEDEANKGVASGYAELDAGVQVPADQLGSGVAGSTTVLTGDRAWETIATILGYTPADGDNLDADNLTTGTIPTLRFPDPLPALSGVNLTNLAVANITGFNGAVDARITNAAVLAALGFTPEDSADKDQANGYAGLTAGSKINLAQVQEVLGIGDLTDVDDTGLATHQFLAFDGTNFTPRGGFPNALAATNLVTAALHHVHTPSTDLNYGASAYPNDPRDSWYWINLVPGPAKIAFGTRGEYSDNGAGANFHFTSYTQNTGTRNTVAAGFLAIQKAAGISWAINPIGFTDVDGAVVATAVADEVNFGSLGTSTAAYAYGTIIYSVATADTVKGSAKAYAQFAVSKVADAVMPRAKAQDGLVFTATDEDPGSGTVSPLVHTVAYGGSDLDAVLTEGGSGAVLKASGISANFVINATASQFGYGIDFADSVFNNAQIRLAGRMHDVEEPSNNAGEARGVALTNAENSAVLNAMEHFYNGAGEDSDGNELWFGDYQTNGNAGSGINQIVFHVERNSAGTTDMGANRARIARSGLHARHFGGWNPSGNAPVISAVHADLDSAVISGTDAAGQITIVTDAGAAPGADAKLFTLTWDEQYPAATYLVFVHPINDVPTGGNDIHVRNRSTTACDFHAETALASGSVTYVFGYWVVMI